MATVSKFLNAYKALETEIRALNPNDSIYDYENRLMESDSAKAEKLKVCRINRNFIQHNADGEKFVGQISDKWISFLEQEANAIHSQNDLMKKHIYKAVAITPKTSIKEAIPIVVATKLDVVPVVENGKFLGVITPKQILGAYMKASGTTKKVMEYITKKSMDNVTVEYSFAKPTDRYIDYVSKDKVIVTSDGTSEGLYIGFKK